MARDPDRRRPETRGQTRNAVARKLVKTALSEATAEGADPDDTAESLREATAAETAAIAQANERHQDRVKRGRRR
jgi:hypothetical protein